jgi:hypothetical protein
VGAWDRGPVIETSEPRGFCPTTAASQNFVACPVALPKVLGCTRARARLALGCETYPARPTSSLGFTVVAQRPSGAQSGFGLVGMANMSNAVNMFLRTKVNTTEVAD